MRLLLYLVFLIPMFVNSQNEIEFGVGTQYGGILGFDQNVANSAYESSFGFSCNAFIMNEYRENRFIGAGLQYVEINSNVVVKNQGYGSYYNANLKLNTLQLMFNISRKIGKAESSPIRIYFRTGFSYIIFSRFQGSGYDFVIKSKPDSTYYITSQDWVKNENNSDEISRLNYLFQPGFECSILKKKNSTVFLSASSFLHIFPTLHREPYDFILGFDVKFGYRYLIKD